MYRKLFLSVLKLSVQYYWYAFCAGGGVDEDVLFKAKRWPRWTLRAPATVRHDDDDSGQGFGLVIYCYHLIRVQVATKQVKEKIVQVSTRIVQCSQFSTKNCTCPVSLYLDSAPPPPLLPPPPPPLLPSSSFNYETGSPGTLDLVPTVTRGKRDLVQRQKRPSIEAKETYWPCPNSHLSLGRCC